MTILVLEGDSDLVTLSGCLDRQHCRVVVAASGKPDAIQAVEFADVEGMEGVLAIVDSDFVDIHESRSSSSRIFYTDLYDLDSSVFFVEGIVERCVEALVGYVAVHGEDASHGDSGQLAAIRDDAVRMASLVGYLRLYAMKGSHELPLDNFPIERVFDGGFQVSAEELKAILPKKCRGVSLSEDMIDAWLVRMESEAIPVRRVSQGHDLFRALSYSVKIRWGMALKADVWEKLARSHWRIDHLRSLRLFDQVLSWSKSTGFCVWVANE
ncbi:hypothetical protein [Streptomyces sp. NPDC058579]|uniref:hypothetical protein n=1 Tax=Streptomyces sp. NPDC058579 TaxID=3346548 RepID=UPI00364D27C4